MQNNIPVRQDEESQLKLLRARTQTFAMATRYMVAQLTLTVLIPVIGSVAGMFIAEVRPYFTMLALLVLVADPLWLDRQYKAMLKSAAKIAEQFDTIVLELDWNPLTVGDRVEVEDIHRAATKYAARRDDSELVGWYPRAVGEIPLHLARLICQRTNLRYDSQLRRNYAGVLIGLVLSITLLVFVVGFAQKLSVPEWVLNLALLSPLLSWSIREFYRQRDTADQIEDLMKSAKVLWERGLAGQCDAYEAKSKAREFQDAIYARRVSSALVMPLVYKLARPGLEDEMNEAATDFLVQYQKTTAQTP